MSYIGHVDGFASVQTALAKYKYVATNNQTTFTSADSNNITLAYTPGNIIITLNGIVLDETDFTATNGTSIVLGTGASTGSELVILTFNDFVVASHYTKTEANNLLAAKLDDSQVGTTANKLIALDGTAKLPAVDGSQLTGLVGGGPSLGTASIISTNANTISENITIPANTNGMSAGPITIADGNTIILNGTWSIV